MRVLLIGGGVPGLALAGSLTADGHAVRFVTRNPGFEPQITETGAECFVADPDRVGTLRYAMDNVTVLLWLLAPAAGELHGSRLTMMMERTIDTTVRGIVYEGNAQGEEIVRRMASYNEIPHAVLDVARTDADAWVRAVRGAIDDVLSVDRRSVSG